MSKTISALVIQLSHHQYLCGDGLGYIGEIQNVPCGLQMEDAEYWAVPQKDEGIFTALDMILVSHQPTPPTFDSFRVFRIYDKLTAYSMWIRGTFSDYANACAVCCGDPEYAMPTDTPLIAPCQTLCQIQTPDGQVQAIFALPNLAEGETYFVIQGAYNNTPFPPGSEAGYSTPSALLSFLNAEYTPFEWTLASNGVTLIATGGYVGDSLCVRIAPFLPSGHASVV